MDIRGINGVNHANQVNKQRQTEKTIKEQAASRSDSVSVSDEARRLAEVDRVKAAALAADDIRADKVAAAKEKLRNGTLITKEVIDEIADRIVDSIGIKTK